MKYRFRLLVAGPGGIHGQARTDTDTASSGESRTMPRQARLVDRVDGERAVVRFGFFVNGGLGGVGEPWAGIRHRRTSHAVAGQAPMVQWGCERSVVIRRMFEQISPESRHAFM